MDLRGFRISYLPVETQDRRLFFVRFADSDPTDIATRVKYWAAGITLVNFCRYPKRTRFISQSGTF